MESQFRSLPGVDKVLSDGRVAGLGDLVSRDVLTRTVQQRLERARSCIAGGEPCPSFDQIVADVEETVRSLGRVSPRPVINATGVIIHTNLGRAPLSHDAVEAMDAAARGYSDLEFDVEEGKRATRHAHVERLLCQVTGAEAGFAVNNNAGVVLLGLSALAKRREVLVSRGQAVEIGGGFRVPDVMRQSGAKLVEVGTTNRTYLKDYEEAITPRTAALLRVHSSNFRVVGFTSQTGIEEMAGLAKRKDVLLLDDVGSGCLLETSGYGLTHEPTVQESVRAGASMVFFSGDKLLGGPQTGIVVGRKDLVEKLKRHPLARALRIDKLCLAALAATLRHYLRGEATAAIPVWRMISMPLPEIEARAQAWARSMDGDGSVTAGESMIGGGSLPGATLPTRLLVIKGKQGISATELAGRLRRCNPPVIGRIEKNTLLLDPRTVPLEQDELLLGALREVLGHA